MFKLIFAVKSTTSSCLVRTVMLYSINCERSIKRFTEICVRFVSYLTGPFMIIYRVEFVLHDVFFTDYYTVDSLLMKALLPALSLSC